MIRKASMKIRRRATKPVRFVFTVTVEKVIFPRSLPEVSAGSEFSVCFERGGKMTSSVDQLPTFTEGGGGEVNFQLQELGLIVTMYQETDKTTGEVKYQEKKGSVVVRRKISDGGSSALRGGAEATGAGEGVGGRGRKGRRAVQYSGVGVIELDLAHIANTTALQGLEGVPTVMKSMVLGTCAVEGVTVMLGVAVRRMDDEASDNALFDDAMSLQSGFSNITLGAADFSSLPLSLSPSPITPQKNINNQQQQQQQQQQGVRDNNTSNKYCDDGDDDASSDTLTSQVGPPSDLMISAESNRVLALQLDENQLKSRHQERRLQELEETVRQLKCHNEQLRVDVVRLKRLASTSDNEKDRAVAMLTDEALKLREALLNQPELQREVQRLSAEVTALQTKNEEKDHSLSVMAASKRFTEVSLMTKMEELGVLRRRLQVYAEKIADMELAAAGVPRRYTADNTTITAATTGGGGRGGGGDSSAGLLTFSGMLTKRGSFYPSWKLRYFELEGKTLNYYVTSESMAWKGNFRLTPTTRLCQEVVIDDRRCFFVQNHKKRLYMCAENSNERDMWVQVLHRCIQALAMQAS